MRPKFLDYSFESVLPSVDKLIKVCHPHNLENSVGKLCLVDPESLALIVATESGIRLLIKTAVLSIEELSIDSQLDLDVEAIELNSQIIQKKCSESSSESKQPVFSEEEVEQNKIKVLQALKESKLIVEENCESGTLKVLNCVQIQSPYIASSCYSANELILDRIQKLLKEVHGSSNDVVE